MTKPLTIPHPPKRIPIIGDVVGIDRVNPNTKTLAQFQALGPIYRRTILGTDLTFVGSVEYAAQAFDDSAWERFAGRPIQQLTDIAGDGLFTAANDSHAWSQAHEALMPGFTREAMAAYHSVMRDVSEQLGAALAEHSEPVVSQQLFARFAHEVIGRAGFSYSFGPNLLDYSHPFPAAMGRALTYVQKSSIPLVGFGGRRARRQYAADRQLLFDTVNDVIAARATTPSDGPADLLQWMLLAGLPAENIAHQLMTFLIAGQETTGSSIGFLLYELGRHPEIRDRVRSEVADVVGESGRLSFEQVAKLRYLRACIAETLRLYPPAPGIFRVATQDTTIGPYQFAAGEWVFVLLLAVHRDPVVWGEDAGQFKPERFFGAGASSGRPSAAYKPFGTGVRSCIGRQFAQHEITVAAAELVRKLDWSVLSPTGPIEFDETLTLRPRDLRFVFTPRS